MDNGYFRSYETPERERGGSSLTPITQTDDHIGPGTIPLATPPRPFGGPVAADKLQQLSRQGIRLSRRQGVGKAHDTVGISNRGVWPRFTRNNDCGHVT